MRNMRKYLFLLFIVLGCSVNLGGGYIPSFNIYFRLDENSEYKILNDSKLDVEQNVELKFEANDNNLIFVLRDKPITDKTAVVKEISSLKVLKKDNTLLQEYSINVNKAQILSTYLPILMEIDEKDDVVESSDVNKKLPSEDEGFSSNILEVFFKDEAKDVLNKRIKKIYYADSSQDKDLEDKNSAIELLKPISEVIKNNYRIRVTKDSLKGKLGLKIYGLEYFEEEKKENLIPLGDKLITSVNLPLLTLADEGGNFETINLNELSDNIGKIKIRPTKYKFIGFEGKVEISYKTKDDKNIFTSIQDADNKLFKFYKDFERDIFENTDIGKLQFKFIYNDNSSRAFNISIPDIVLKYRTNDKEDKYISLPYAPQTFKQNIELILEGEDGDLYVNNVLVNKLNGKSSTILKNPVSNIKIKSKLENSLLTLRECEIKIEKENINSYAPILIKNDQEKLVPLRENENALPSEVEGFNSNILEIFVKNSAKDLLRDRIKKLYYIDTSDDSYNFEDKSSAKEIDLENLINNGFKVTKNKLNGKLGLKLYGLEYFEEEKKENLISLGDSLLTSAFAPLITLKDELGNIEILNMNESINSIANIDFNPTKYSLVGFKGNLEINYKDAADKVFNLYKGEMDDTFFKEFSNFNFIPTLGTNVKEIQFKFVYSSASSFVTTIKSPSYTLKYKLRDSDAYQNFDYTSLQQLDQNIKIKLEGDEANLYYPENQQDIEVQDQNDEISLVIKDSIDLKIKSKDKNKILNLFKIKITKDKIGSTYFPYLVKGGINGIALDIDENNILPSKDRGFSGNKLEIHIKGEDNSRELLQKRIKAIYYVDSLTANYDLNNKKSAKIMPINLEDLMNNGFSLVSKVIKGDLGLRLYGLEYLDELGQDQENLVPLGDVLLTSASTPLMFLEKGSGAGDTVDAGGILEVEKIVDFRPIGYTIGGFKGTITIEYISKGKVINKLNRSINSLTENGSFDLTSEIDRIIVTFQYGDTNLNNIYKLMITLPSS